MKSMKLSGKKDKSLANAYAKFECHWDSSYQTGAMIVTVNYTGKVDFLDLEYLPINCE